MKILFAGSYNEGDVFTGPEKVANRIFNSASNDRENFRTAFVTYFSDGKKYGILKKLFGKSLISSGKDNVFRFGLFSVLFYAIKFKPDIIHIITFERFAVILYLIRLFSKVKFIYNVHGIVVYENSINKNATAGLKAKDSFSEKIFLKYSDTLIFLSEISKDTAGKYYDLKEAKSVVIPNGIDREFYEAGKRRKPFLNGKLKIVFIGDIHKKEKGFNELSSALDKIDFDIELYAVSVSKPDKESSDILSSKKNLSFHLKGKMGTDKLAEFLTDKIIFVSSSSYEQFSIAAAESMAAGLVPVVSSATGMSTYIENNVNGFVYGSEEELISILTELNSNLMLINNISKEAEKIYEVLNQDKIYERYKDLYLSFKK